MVKIILSSSFALLGVHHLITLGIGVLILANAKTNAIVSLFLFYWLFTIVALSFFQLELDQHIRKRS